MAKVRGAERYLPISEYGMIGDSRSAALVSSRGSIDWCCLPCFDSDSVFSAILDAEKGGSFSLAPVGEFRSQQSYLPDTNVLELIFETGSGRARLLDSFSVTSEARKRNRLMPDHEILRILEGLEGEVRIRMDYSPRPGFGSKRAMLTRRGGLGIACDLGEEIYNLHSDLDAESIEILQDGSGSRAVAEFTLRAGEKTAFSLTYSHEGPAVIPPVGSHAEERLEETRRYWKCWIDRSQYSGPYDKHVRRSALALKLLTYAPSGAVVAAPTTSLPETPGGVRNWDYRYCWLRDAAFTVRTLISLGYREEARAYVSWLLHSTYLTRPRLQVVYSVYGQAKLPERILPWLEGYRSSQPVRTGNAADDQVQLDVYGEVMDAIWAWSPEASELDKDTREFVLDLGKAVCELWQEPDHGIWEVRSRKAHHTHSKALAWVALDRLIRLAEKNDWKADLEGFRKTRDEIRGAIERHGYSEELGSYVRTLGGSELDASLLTLPLVGYCGADDPRMLSTCRTISEHLSRNRLIYRYRKVDDGVEGGEKSFGICNFWLAENLARAGQVDEAKEWFEALLSKAAPTGLWSEEIDPESFEFLGNYPQAFTHIGLINAAVAISDASAAKGSGKPERGAA